MSETQTEAPRLERSMGLLPATATNIIGMVGVGPFLTIPFMIAAMNGPHAVNVPPVPEAARDLLLRVKAYERLTVRAALEGSADLTVEALILNPLVGRRELAQRLVAEVTPS